MQNFWKRFVNMAQLFDFFGSKNNKELDIFWRKPISKDFYEINDNYDDKDENVSEIYLEKNILISNNVGNKLWIESFETKFKWARDAIMADYSLFIYNPFNDKELESLCLKLNNLRNCHYFNIDPSQKQEVSILKLKCQFHLIKCWCLEIVYQRIKIPDLLKKEHLFEIYFKNLMINKYENNNHKIYDDDYIFIEISNEIKEIKYDSFYEILIFGYIANIKQVPSVSDICKLILKFHPIFYDPIQ